MNGIWWCSEMCACLNCIMKILHKTLVLSMVFHSQFQIISFLRFLYQKKKKSWKIWTSSKITSSSGISTSGYHPNTWIPCKMVIVISYLQRHSQWAVFKILCLSLRTFAFTTYKVRVAKIIRLFSAHFLGKDGCLCSICLKFHLLVSNPTMWMSDCLVANLSLPGRRQQCNGHSLKQPGLRLDFHIHYVESKHILVLMDILELFLTNNEGCLDLKGLTHCCTMKSRVRPQIRPEVELRPYQT